MSHGPSLARTVPDYGVGQIFDLWPPSFFKPLPQERVQGGETYRMSEIVMYCIGLTRLPIVCDGIYLSLITL